MSNELAAFKSSLPTLPDGKGLGFDCLDSTDLVASRLSIAQPASQTEVEQGNWYDVNSDQNHGKEIQFFVLSKRTTHFQAKDMQTGADKMIEKKEILVMPMALDFPQIISLSVTGYWPLSNLLTKLFKTYGKAGYPIFTGLIKATTELVMGDKGKYYIPKFEFVRHATKDEMTQLLKAYEEVAPLFNIATESPVPSAAPFEAPTPTRTYPDPIAGALDITESELKEAGKLEKKDPKDDFLDIPDFN